MPVINVIERSTIERARPVLKTPTQTELIQVSIDTQKAARTTHHAMRMIRSMRGARAAAAMGSGGGSMVASGSRLESRSRNPGRISSAAAMAKNGSDGTMAAFQKLSGGM